MGVKAKRRGLGLDMRTFEGSSGNAYVVFRTNKGAFHVFQEVEAKAAAKDCGARNIGNTRQMWGRNWKR